MRAGRRLCFFPTYPVSWKPLKNDGDFRPGLSPRYVHSRRRPAPAHLTATRQKVQKVRPGSPPPEKHRSAAAAVRRPVVAVRLSNGLRRRRGSGRVGLLALSLYAAGYVTEAAATTTLQHVAATHTHTHTHTNTLTHIHTCRCHSRRPTPSVGGERQRGP